MFRDLHSNTSLNIFLFFFNSDCFGPFQLWPGASRPAWKPHAAFATHNSARVVPLRDKTTMSIASIYNSTCA